MRRIALVGTLGLVMLAGCPSDNNTQADAGGCGCTPPTALQVTYDKTSSQLGAGNVQDAVDELAARPLPEPPLAGRIENIQKQVDNDGSALLSVTLECPAATDIALGGGCNAIPTPAGTKLLGFGVGQVSSAKQGISCLYEQPAGRTDKPQLNVVCLHKAQ